MRRARLKFIAPMALALSIALSACGTVEQTTTYYPLTNQNFQNTITKSDNAHIQF